MKNMSYPLYKSHKINNLDNAIIVHKSLLKALDALEILSMYERIKNNFTASRMFEHVQERLLTIKHQYPDLGINAIDAITTLQHDLLSDEQENDKQKINAVFNAVYDESTDLKSSDEYIELLKELTEHAETINILSIERTILMRIHIIEREA